MSNNHEADHSMRRSVLIGAVASALLVFGVGGMSVFTRLTGAVIAEGTLVVDSNVKKIQHSTGGIVAQILVRDGDKVHTGDILVKLDDTQTKANLAIITKSQDELAAKEARDLAERDDKDSVHFPQGLLDRIDDPQVAEAVTGERRLFEIRKNAREGQKAQLTERIAQLSEQITGLDTQQASRTSQIDWINKELEGVRGLWDKKLVAYTRLTSLEREGSRLDGERGQLISQIAETKGKIAETRLQIIQVDQDMRSEIGKDLADIRAKQVELSEKRIAAQDQMNRIDIRAPLDGVVHQLSVHTVGGVINTGEQIMLVVPENEALIVETRVSPQDIDQIWVDQHATLKFTTFNQRTTPELNGNVILRSADITQDPKTNASYYTVRISVPDDELKKLAGLKLMAGMPVEAFITTSERSMASYLVRPLHDQLARAFAEK
jgi:HlyD family secretion protein